MLLWFLRQMAVMTILIAILIGVVLFGGHLSNCRCLIYVAFIPEGYSMSAVITYDMGTGVAYRLFKRSNVRDITLSPDGQILYFVQNRPNRLFQYDIYTKEMSRVISGFVEYPMVSADGQNLAFILDDNFGGGQNRDTGIHIATTSGGIPHHLSHITNTPIAWHPDNQHVTFNQWNENSNLFELVMVNIETSEQHILFSHEIPIGWHQWSSDGLALAYYTQDWVYLLDVATQTHTPLTDNSRRPVWSRDGNLVVYIEQNDPTGKATMNLARRDGSIIARIPYHADGFVTRVNWWYPR